MTEIIHSASGIVHGTPEWHTARSNGVTGTDLGAILGVNQYRSRMDVFMSKTVGGPPFQDNEYVKWGRLLEPVVAQEWARIHNFEIEPGTFVAKDWMLGSPDFLVKNYKHGVEIKTAGYTQLKSYKEGKCPLSYEYQCRWYMMIMEYDKWSLAALVGGQRMFEFDFHRDTRIEKMMIDAAKEFWDQVLEWREKNQR